MLDCDLCGVVYNTNTSPEILTVVDKRIGRQYFLCPYCHNKILQFIDELKKVEIKKKEEKEDDVKKILLTKENLKYHCTKDTAIGFNRMIDEGYEIYLLYKDYLYFDYEIKKKGE